MRKDMQVQVRVINVDKWNEGCKIKKDPGKKYIYQWIEKNAKQFREDWNNSLCKHCVNWEVCGYKLKKTCSDFIKDS